MKCPISVNNETIYLQTKINKSDATKTQQKRGTAAGYVNMKEEDVVNEAEPAASSTEQKWEDWDEQARYVGKTGNGCCTLVVAKSQR